jgi:hypothetical protein
MVKWKGFGRKHSQHNFKILSGNSPEGTEKNHENLNKDSLFSSRDLKPEPSVAGVLATIPQCSVRKSQNDAFEYQIIFLELLDRLTTTFPRFFRSRIHESCYSIMLT